MILLQGFLVYYRSCGVVPVGVVGRGGRSTSGHADLLGVGVRLKEVVSIGWGSLTQESLSLLTTMVLFRACRREVDMLTPIRDADDGT